MSDVSNVIKFSHRYYKMPQNVENYSTVLLEAFRVLHSDLSDFFLVYDTKYPGGEYPLRNGEMIVLLLMTQLEDHVCLWTTIRTYNPGKWRYYQGIRGEPVRIIIEGE